MTDTILKAWRAENADQRQRVKRAGESEVVEDRIDALLDEVERLRAALQPFAACNPKAASLDEWAVDWKIVWGTLPTIGDCGRAKEVLA